MDEDEDEVKMKILFSTREQEGRQRATTGQLETLEGAFRSKYA